MPQYTLIILVMLFAITAMFSKQKQMKLLFYFAKPAAALILIVLLYYFSHFKEFRIIFVY